MKKVLILVITALLVISIISFVKIKELNGKKKEILAFNKEFEYYTEKSILGTDITTLMNRATNNNEKFNIPKDTNGNYLEDGEKSIKIYIKMKFTNSTYPMENFYKAGISEFTKYFGDIYFKNVEILYNKNGRISSMTFEEI